MTFENDDDVFYDDEREDDSDAIDICPDCNGSGEGQCNGSRCWNCRGIGSVDYCDCCGMM